MSRPSFGSRIFVATAVMTLAFGLSVPITLAADDGSTQYDPSGAPYSGRQGASPPPGTSAAPAPAPGAPGSPANPGPGRPGSGSTYYAPATPPSDGARQNPLPDSASAPALITVNPWAIDPGVENTLNLFGRNLSAQTRVQIEGISLRIADSPDEWHLLVHIPAGLLSEGQHNIVMTNIDGQSDTAMGVLRVRSQGIPQPLVYVGLGLLGLLVLLRVFRWLTA